MTKVLSAHARRFVEIPNTELVENRSTLENEKLREAIQLFLRAGYHLDIEAFNLLSTISKAEDATRLSELALKRLETHNDKTLFITRSLLEEATEVTFLKAKEPEPITTPTVQEPSALAVPGKSRRKLHSHAKSIEKDIEVLEDPTDKICSTGSIDEYLEYFHDRFKRIRRLLRQRMDSRNAISIKEVFRAPPKSRVTMICIITDKRESKHGTFLLTEDLESSATILVPSNAPPELIEKTKLLLPDQVVSLSLVKGRKGLLILEDVALPDIPQAKPHKAKEPVHVALISDLHVGSKEFMREEFNRFVLWLNGKYGNERLRETASLVKYVIIAGDIVDGIGVYPNQFRELAERDIFKQYKLAAQFLEQIPDYVELIVIPGNHDASRKALPQPAIPKEYAEVLYEARNLLSLGNPATVSIHGVRFLIYHGRSLDDVLATAPDMNYHSPDRAMRLLLQGRHLAPTYGQRTSIAPEKRDFLVVEQVPDVFHAGHVHVMKYDSYRGTLIVNSGAWQRQTSYQRNLGLEPTPGIIPVLDLQTLSVLPIDFNV